MGGCFSCHNNVVARGKPPAHIPTANSCGDCHVTTAWTTVAFDHSATKGTCFSCHNNIVARGKPPEHIPANNSCGDCHVTTAWTTVAFDHSAARGTCFSCHNNIVERGKPPDHIRANNACGDCHATTAWTSPGFDHAAARGSCATCHANAFRPQAHLKVDGALPVFYKLRELQDCAGACHIYKDKGLSRIKERRNREHRATGGQW